MKNTSPPDSFRGLLIPWQAGRFLKRCGALILLLLLLMTQAAMAVTAGGFYTLAIKSDGTLWAWGKNSEGQLGDGSNDATSVPKLVASGFSAVAAGDKHTLALKPDRTLWAWGLNGNGQLGDGTQISRSSPVSVGSGFSSMSAGEQHTVALKSDGSLWAWGYNVNGQVGDGTASQRLSPVKIGTDFVSVAAGYQHTLAIKNDGSLWAWGNNGSGQLGDGTTTNRSSPVMIGTGFTAVAAGQTHTVALKADGSLWAWGSNALGQLGLGNGTTASQNTPIQVATGFSYVTTGVAHTVALKTDGTLWAWGYNGFGQLGDGSLINQSSPVQIDTGVTSFAAGYAHTVAFKSEGTLWAWGHNEIGQLGDGSAFGSGNKQVKPVQITLTAGFADNQAPTAPTGLAASAASSSQINLAWAASTDNLGVASYRVYRDGVLIAVLGNVIEASIAGLKELTAYSFSLAACDEANNCSSRTSAVTATTSKPSAPLSAIALSCPTSINSKTSGTCSTIATYQDGATKSVSSTLSSSNTAALNAAAASLTAGSVTTDTVVTITAAYTENSITKTATASVTVKAPAVTPSGTVTPVTKPDDVVSNPGANVSVDSSGALVVTKTTTPIVLSSAAPENALVKLQTLDPVSFTSGTTTLQYTDQVGAAQLVIRTVNNQPQLEVAKGTVEISAPASGITISVVSSNQKSVGSIVTQTTADKVVVDKTDTTSAVFVDAGKVNYQGPGQTTAVPVYQGENTQLDTSGTLNQLALGSLGGKKQVPGDPLPLTTTPKDTATKVPNLEGNLPRFNNTITLQDIVREMIKDLVKDTTGLGKLSYDKSTGVITYAVGTTTYRLIALGDVLVQLNQFAATTAAATAGGAYTLASRGIQMSLSGALGYFSDLQTLVKAADANGTLNLKPTGAIELRVGAGHYVVMPGSGASLPNNPTLLPGFEADPSGYAVFRDHLGTLQTLYPAFLDVDTLSSTFKSAAPTIVMTNKPDGTVTAVLAGQNYTIRPEYVVVDQPVGHAAEAYWLDSGMFYLRNANLSAQAFRVR